MPILCECDDAFAGARWQVKSAYELQREKNVEENRQKMHELGILQPLSSNVLDGKRKRKDEPEPEPEQEREPPSHRVLHLMATQAPHPAL